MSRKFTYLLPITMSYRSAKGFTGWAQLGILFAFIGVGLILAAIAQGVIGLSLTDHSLPLDKQLLSLEKILTDPRNSFYLQLSQAVSTLLLMFLPAFVYMRICHGKDPLWLGFSPRINVWQVIIGFFVIMGANFAAGMLADVSKYICSFFPDFNKWALAKENAYNEMALAISSIKSSWGAFFLALIIMAFLPAVFEEVLFRGALQNLLVRWTKNPWAGIIITSLIFSLIHGTVYSFLSRALLGFALGWLYYRSKNLWVNIFAHFFNNAIVVVQLFVIARSNEKMDISKLDEKTPLPLALFSVLALIGLFILFDRVSAKKRAAIETDEQKLWIKSTPQYNLANNQN